MKKSEKGSGIPAAFRRNSRNRIAAAAFAVLLLILVIAGLARCAGEEEMYSPEEGNLPDTTKESYGVFLGIDQKSFSIDIFEPYDFVVIDAQELRTDQLAQLHAKGHTVYSYLNVGSVEKSRDYFRDYRDCCLDRYENWPDEYWVDVTRQEWKQFVSRELVDAILKQDPRIDGLFLDNLDIYSHVQEKKKYRANAEKTYEALKEILLAYQEADLPVLVNGADVFVSSLIEEGEEDLIRGVNQETVFSRILDYDRDRFGTQEEEDLDYYTGYLRDCRKAGLEVCLLEYTQDPEVESRILNYCEENGFRCYISAHVNLAPEED